MKINKSGAALSRIVQIGETLKELSQKSGKEYLPLNRGVNQVVNIDLTEVVKSINFNSPEIQVYPHGAGRPDLRAAINEEFFAGKSTFISFILYFIAMKTVTVPYEDGRHSNEDGREGDEDGRRGDKLPKFSLHI